MAYHVAQPDVDDALVAMMQRYTVRDQVEVKRILQRYPFLSPVLAEALERIPRYFPGSPLSLWILSDPERDTGDDTDEIVLSIETSLEAPEAMARRERLADEWWLDELPATKGRLSIDVEFV